MLNDNAKLWVKALRSGEYKQCTQFLHIAGSDGDEFCCLGVACDLYIKEGNELEVKRNPYDAPHTVRYNEITSVLPREVRDWLGLRSEDGLYNAPIQDRTLVGDNDNGKTFEEIADIIESEPEGLFRVAI